MVFFYANFGSQTMVSDGGRVKSFVKAHQHVLRDFRLCESVPEVCYIALPADQLSNDSKIAFWQSKTHLIDHNKSVF